GPESMLRQNAALQGPIPYQPGNQQRNQADDPRPEQHQFPYEQQSVCVSRPRNQTVFAKNLIQEQVPEKIRVLALPGTTGRQIRKWHSEQMSEFFIQFGALPHRRGKIDSPQKERSP